VKWTQGVQLPQRWQHITATSQLLGSGTPPLVQQVPQVPGVMTPPALLLFHSSHKSIPRVQKNQWFVIPPNCLIRS